MFYVSLKAPPPPSVGRNKQDDDDDDDFCLVHFSAAGIKLPRSRRVTAVRSSTT